MTTWDNGGTNHRGNKNKGSISTHVVTFAATDTTATRNVILGSRNDKGGILMGIAIDITGGTNTADITIEDNFDDSTLAVFTNVAADVAPSMFVSDAIDDSGVAAADIGEGLYFRGGLSVEVAQNDAATVITLWVKR